MPAPLRVWNVLVLASLQKPDGTHTFTLWEHFVNFSLAFGQSLGVYQQPQHAAGFDMHAPSHSDISSAYAAIKLWLLFARKVAQQGLHRSLSEGTRHISKDEELENSRMVWNELWPPFERLMSIFEADAHAGNPSVRY